MEPIDSPQKPAEMRGIDAIRGKNERWVENNEIHTADAIGPFVGEDQFAVRYEFDFTAKQSGQRMQMSEMGLYTVKDGKIVREQFFYQCRAPSEAPRPCWSAGDGLGRLFALRAPLVSFSVCFSRRCNIRCRHDLFTPGMPGLPAQGASAGGAAPAAGRDLSH